VNTVRIGDVEVHRVLERVGPIKTVDELFPDTPADTWTDVSAQHWTPHTRAYRAAIQTWVLRSAGRTVLIDTGVGNDRDRPQAPSLDHLRTAFLQRLGDAGVQPADVDLVINTHIHYDHVGWNTRLNGGRWTPTFPNATYLVPQADYDHFHPGNAGQMRPPRTEDEKARFDGARLVFADSITPIDEAGQMHTWDGEHRVDRHLRLAPAPGHTPGSSVVWLETGDGAVFVGDLIHTPLQIGRPEDACTFDLDADRARTSRRTILDAAARTGATIFPAHFAGHGATTVVRTGTSPLHAGRWTALPEV